MRDFVLFGASNEYENTGGAFYEIVSALPTQCIALRAWVPHVGGPVAYATGRDMSPSGLKTRCTQAAL